MLNNRLLPSLFLLLIGVPVANGQNTARKLAIETLSPLATQIQQLPQEFSKNQHFVAPELVLDSTVNFNNYVNGDSSRYEKSAFEYPDMATKVETQFLFDGSWQAVARTTGHTDNMGRLLEVLAETWDTETDGWLNESYLQVFPHGNSATDLDSMIVSGWNPADNSWHTAFKTTTTYDNQDRPVSVTTFFSIDGLGTFTIVDINEYDENGDNYFTTQYVVDQGVAIPFGTVVREFDQHREIESITYVFVDDVNTLPELKQTTEYNEDGNAIVKGEYSYDPQTGDWIQTKLGYYTYDNSQRLVSQTDITTAETQIVTKTEYKYIEDTNLANVAIFNLNAGTGQWELQDRTYYYYNGSSGVEDQWIVGKLSMSPNPTTGQVKLPEVTGNAQIQVFSQNGQLLKSELNIGLQPELDLSALPAGLYLVSVKDETGLHTGSVVKQ